MRILIPFALVAASVWAQAPARPADADAAAAAAAKAAVEKGSTQAKPAASPAQSISLGTLTPPPISLLALQPDMVVATVDGRDITAGDLQSIVRSLPPQMQQQALSNRRQLIEQYAVARQLSAEAEKAKLDQVSPWKESLRNVRIQLLAQATISQKLAAMTVPAEEQKQFYESNKDRYTQAKVKAIYIPFSNAPVSQPDPKGKKVLTEAEAKAKAEDLVKQARAGADFVKLVKENSGDPTSAAKDGDFGAIKKNDRLPEPVKAALFNHKAGEITDPLRQTNGYYVFRIQEIGPQPFEQVQEAISNELKNGRFMEWMKGLQKGLDIKMKDGIEVSGTVLQPGSRTPAPPKQ